MKKSMIYILLPVASHIGETALSYGILDSKTAFKVIMISATIETSLKEFSK